MGIIDDVVVNAKSAAESVGKTASMWMDVSKLKINMSELNGEIVKKKQLLGEYVYDLCHDSALGNPEISGKIAEIDELVEQVNLIGKSLLDRQNKTVCTVCGRTSPTSALFCSGCGAKLERMVPPAAKEAADAEGAQGEAVKEAAPEPPASPEAVDAAAAPVENPTAPAANPASTETVDPPSNHSFPV